jgi:hypothetical protein
MGSLNFSRSNTRMTIGEVNVHEIVAQANLARLDCFYVYNMATNIDGSTSILASTMFVDHHPAHCQITFFLYCNTLEVVHSHNATFEAVSITWFFCIVMF